MDWFSRLADWMEDTDWDRTQEQDGHTYYGSDNGDGTTTWYDESGNCDCVTDTPEDDEDW